MDKNKFSSKSLGQLILIDTPDNEYAFVPYELPLEWQIPLKLWPLLSDAKEALARLDGVGRHMANYGLLLRPLQKREALTSSSLEGTYATPEELLLYELEPKIPTSPSDKVNVWREVSKEPLI